MRWLILGTVLSVAVGVLSSKSLYESALMARLNASDTTGDSAPFPSGFYLGQKDRHPASTLQAETRGLVEVEREHGQVIAPLQSAIDLAESGPESGSNPKIPVWELYTATEERRVGDRIPVNQMFTVQGEKRVGERIPVEDFYTSGKVIKVGEPIPVDIIISNFKEVRIGDRIPPPDDENLIIANP